MLLPHLTSCLQPGGGRQAADDDRDANMINSMVPAKLATALSDMYITNSSNITTNVIIYIPGSAVAALLEKTFLSQ